MTAEEKLEKLLRMHRRKDNTVLCGHCLRVYPCPTVHIITGSKNVWENNA